MVVLEPALSTCGGKYVFCRSSLTVEAPATEVAGASVLIDAQAVRARPVSINLDRSTSTEMMALVARIT